MLFNARNTNTAFVRMKNEEPHKSRRAAILAKHPEIKQLFGPDIRLFPSIVALVAVQYSLNAFAYLYLQSAWQWLLLAYTLGGTVTHWLSLGNHELSHNLCFRTTRYNEWLGMFANLAQGLPSAITFKRYHLEHHYFQGVDDVDVDIPTDWEGRVFDRRWKKVIFVFLQPLFYALRPMFVNPKPMIVEEAFNFFTTISFDLLMWYFVSIRIPLFNIASTLLGMGLHPVAGHFISEHYTMTDVRDPVTGTLQETSSYYGRLNWVAFNVGYHNERHDFPRVSGFRLPEVKRIAPEFYEPLHSYKSWSGVIFDYIFRSDVGPYSRVMRRNWRKVPKDDDGSSEEKKGESVADAPVLLSCTMSESSDSSRSASSSPITVKDE